MKSLLCNKSEKPKRCEDCQFYRYHLDDTMIPSVICIVNNAIKFNLTELYKVCPLIGIDKKSIERGLRR